MSAPALFEEVIDSALARLQSIASSEGKASPAAWRRACAHAQGNPLQVFLRRGGLALFEQICELPEYYQTRTETALLGRHAGEIAALIGGNAEIVEFGAGSLRKVRILLDGVRKSAPIRRWTFPATIWARSCARWRRTSRR